MSALGNRIGPYHYADGFLEKKVFNEGSGRPRTFTVLISSAYNAGIIGPEINGIVVLDDDHRAVVLDQHARAVSGYDGPTDLQKRSLKAIMEADWAMFSRFCSTHPRYRGGIPDFGKPQPDEGRALLSDEVIFPASAKPMDTECPYDFSLSTRREIIEFLSQHEGHEAGRRDFALSWNIKVSSPDMSGSKYAEEFGLNSAFDLRWEKAVDRDYTIFWDACADGLSQWTQKGYTTWADNKQGRYEFSTAGRSGGHLVLTSIDGKSVTASSKADFINWLEEEATNTELVELYKVVVSCDRDLRNPDQEIECQMAARRQRFEADCIDARAHLSASDLKTVESAETIGARFYEEGGRWRFEFDSELDCDDFDSEADAARNFFDKYIWAPNKVDFLRA